MPTILIVDDTIANLDILSSILSKDYRVQAATSGKVALKIARSKPDLILLDIMMPDMNGYEVCQKLKSDPVTCNIPVIFVSAMGEVSDEEKGFQVGAVDYIMKPVHSALVRARVSTHLKLNNQTILLSSEVDRKTKEITMLNHEIEDTQKEVVFTMGAIGESRSKETGSHVKRVAEYSWLLASLSRLKDDQCNLIKMASPMHDIGKVGIPDRILNKPGKLDFDEFEIMKTHAMLGYDMLNVSSRPILKAAATIAISHHEKWDGSGYPSKTHGDNIPIFGRITALADVFDALGSDRCYKKAWCDKDIFDLLQSEKGNHFDPSLIDLFFSNIDLFKDIRSKFN